MSRQLLDAYRFAQAQGADAERRWMKSCTPYERGVLERALANEAEDLAHPLPGDEETRPTAPVVVGAFGPISSGPPTVLPFEPLQTVLSSMIFASPPIQHFFLPPRHYSANDRIDTSSWRQISRSQETHNRIDTLAFATGLPVKDLRKRFRDYVAQRQWSAEEAISEFCSMVSKEVFGHPVRVITTSRLEITVSEPRSSGRRSFKDGLRLKRWER